MAPISPASFENDPLSVSSLPKVEALSFTSLSPKHLVKRNISTTISFIVFLGITICGYYFYPELFRGYFPLALAAVVLIFLWTYFHNYQWHKRSGYALRERDIVYRRGFLSEKTTVVPFNRVQHVSTSRGVLDKALGLSNLLVFTAGGSGSDISIPGLTPELAATLKEALSERMASYV